MKHFIIIINMLITKSLSSFEIEPIYKYQLKNMYENEKNKFINDTVDNCVNQLYNLVISNAKLNINTTYFDLFHYYFLNKIQKELDDNRLLYSFLDDTYEQNRCKNRQKDNVYNIASYLINFNSYSQQVPYNIPIELITSKILDKILFIFPDSNLSKIDNKYYCIDTYSISWS